jgi:hypothetical protein
VIEFLPTDSAAILRMKLFNGGKKLTTQAQLI